MLLLSSLLCRASHLHGSFPSNVRVILMGDTKNNSISLSGPASPYHHGGHEGDYKNIEALSTAKPSGGFESEYTLKDSSAYDFLWTIKSFSKIVVDTESKQASGRFESNGYSWKLILYPNGDIVNGQISLYLMLSKSSTHTLEAVFKVSYVLFLFDQNTGGALSRKGENNGQVKDKMGFRSMIDLKTFKESSNGYLVEDNCMFGVKILQIIPIQTPSECMFPVKKVNHEHSWKIENFSKLDKKTMHEMKFTAGDYLWSVRIHPEGDQKSDIKVNDGNVSLYMSYSGSIHDTSAMKVSVEFSLSINDQINGTHKKRTYTEVFKCSQPGWGWRDFMPLKDFNDPALGFIVNDTCIIVAQVVVLGLVK